MDLGLVPLFKSDVELSLVSGVQERGESVTNVNLSAAFEHVMPCSPGTSIVGQPITVI